MRYLNYCIRAPQNGVSNGHLLIEMEKADNILSIKEFALELLNQLNLEKWSRKYYIKKSCLSETCLNDIGRAVVRFIIKECA
jgi:hypothetical protein